MCTCITIQLTRTKSNSHFHTWYPIIRQIGACSVELHDAAVVRFGQEPLAKLVLEGKAYGLFSADLDGRLEHISQQARDRVNAVKTHPPHMLVSDLCIRGQALIAHACSGSLENRFPC
jgi:hypothetical protein